MGFYKEINRNNAQIHLANKWWDFMKKSIMHKYIWPIRGGIFEEINGNNAQIHLANTWWAAATEVDKCNNKSIED